MLILILKKTEAYTEIIKRSTKYEGGYQRVRKLMR